MTDATGERGSFDATPAPLLLLQLYRKRFTGSVAVRREGVEKRLVLRDGVPVMAESNLPSESLGIQLLDAGRITREDYARVVAIVQQKRCKEGAALLGLQLVAPRELFEALKLQVRRRLIDCLGWPRGEYALEPGEPSAEDASAFRCDPVPLVQEAVAIHWSGAAIRAALGAKLERWTAATPRTANAAQRLHRDTDVDRLVAGIGGPEPLGALLDAARAPTALAAAWVLDALGVLAYTDHPPEVAGEEAPEDSLEIEVVVAGAEPGAASADAPRASAQTAVPRVADAQAARLREEVAALHAGLRDRNHYEILGIPADASPAAIRRAYFAAAKRFHPDAVTRLGLLDLRDAAGAVFARIAQAHEVLSDPAQRSDYDRSLESGGEDVDAARLVQAEALYRKAEILLRGGNFAGALEFLRPAVALWPEEPAYQSALGWALYKKLPSDPKAARERLEAALALDAADAVSHFRLGMVLRALGEEEAANASLRRAKELDPRVRS